MQALGILGLAVTMCVAAGCGGDDDGSATDGGSVSDSGGGGSDSGGATVCQTGCAATLAASCSMGPRSMAMCVSDCEMLLGGSCGSEFDALQSCSMGQAVTCDASGMPVVAPCMTEQDAFIACLSGM